MTNIRINKMLESTGGNYITLKRITLDQEAASEIRLTAFLAIDKKFGHPAQEIFDQDFESNELKISMSNNKLDV